MKIHNLLFLLLFLYGCGAVISNSQKIYENSQMICEENEDDEFDEGFDDAYARLKPAFPCDVYYMEGYKEGKKQRKEDGL